MFNRPAFLTQKIEGVTISNKEKHNNLSSKLNKPCTHCTKYWSLPKKSVDGGTVPLTLTIQIGCKFITNFTEKAKVFTNYFAKQCKVTDKWKIRNIKFANMDILKSLKTLDMKKVHRHDNVSIRIIKLCCDSICKPIELIFPPCKRVCFERGSVFLFVERSFPLYGI